MEAAACRLVLVVAPAGSGKTSLISQWCQEQDPGRVAWLTLDAQDSDPNRFLHYLCGALERVAPQAVRPVGALFAAPEPPSPEDAVTLLLNGLAALVKPVTLVLSDYHVIESPAVHGLVAFLLEHQPPTLHLILSSRFDPPLPLARLRARGELVETRARDLRLTFKEASCFLNERMGLDLAPEAVRRLTERTEGWITGLQLAALSLQGHPDPGQFVEAFSGSHRYVVDYLMEEVLARQPPEVRTFLRQTAILEQLCAPLCEAVIGQGEPPGYGQAMLEQLEAANLFLIPLDEERRWYRYHHLFAEVLRARPETLPAAELVTLHERAAAWYEAEGMVAEALGHALASCDFGRVIRLLDAPSAGISPSGEPWNPESRVRATLSPRLRTQPLYSLAMGAISYYQMDVDEVERLLGPSLSEMPKTPDTRELRGVVQSALGVAAYLRGGYDAAEARAREALALLARTKDPWRGGALRTRAAVCADRGHLEQATQILVESREESRELDSPVPLLLDSYCLGKILESQGALTQAGCLYQDALEFARARGGLDFSLAGPLLAVLGRLCHERNDLPGALAHLEEALERTRSRPVGIELLHGFVALVEMLRVLAALGETAAAGAVFEQLEAAARGPAARIFEPVVAALRVRRPETPAAEVRAWLEAFEARLAGNTLPIRPMPEPCPLDAANLEIATWVQLRLAQGLTEPVVARLERLLEILVQQGRHGSALPWRSLLAGLLWERRRQEQAVSVLEPALALAAREGYVRVFLDAGCAITPVLRACAAQGISSEYVGTLLAAFGAPLARPRARAPAPPGPGDSGCPSSGRDGAGPPAHLEPLSERQLEVLRLAAAGLSNSEIAAQLFLGTGTVKRHMHNINGKLGVTSRLGAIARARTLGLL
jgi:LuxR family maltose regulon positive regulatory protein